MKSDKKRTPVSLRLSEEQYAELLKISESTGADISFLCRTAVDGLINYMEASGGKLHLPIDFQTAWTDLKSVLEHLEANDPDKPKA